MVPMGGTDEWVAGIASYVRNSFGNSGGMVTPADVARVRAETAGRKTPWTLPELEASLPRAARRRSSGSSPPATAPKRRRRRSDAPRLDLRRAAGAGHVVHRGTAAARGRDRSAVRLEHGVRPWRTWRPRRAGGRGRPAPAPVIGFPRGYTVQVSMDGTTWSKPVAEGKGDGAAHDDHASRRRGRSSCASRRPTPSPTRRAWSIRNLRIYEAPATRAASR